MTTHGTQKQLELEMMVVVVHRAAMGSNRCCPSPKLVIVIVDTSGNLMAAMLPILSLALLKMRRRLPTHAVRKPQTTPLALWSQVACSARYMWQQALRQAQLRMVIYLASQSACCSTLACDVIAAW